MMMIWVRGGVRLWQSLIVTLACVTALASRASYRCKISSSVPNLSSIPWEVYGVSCTVTYVGLDVLPPRPLKCFTFKDLLESQHRLHESGQNSMVNALKTLHKIKGAATKQVRRRTTRRTIVLLISAATRGRLATYIINPSTGWAQWSEGHLIVSVSCLGSALRKPLPICQPLPYRTNCACVLSIEGCGYNTRQNKLISKAGLIEWYVLCAIDCARIVHSVANLNLGLGMRFHRFEGPRRSQPTS